MLNYIQEARTRILKVLMLFLGIFLCCFCFSKGLFCHTILPFFQNLPQNGTLIATSITSTIFTPLKIAIDFAFFLTLPFILFHIWRFAEPALYRKEQQVLKNTIILSIFLFFVGVLFCYFVVLPLMISFFIQALPSQVRLLPDMADATNFIIRMLILFGISFQVPLVCFVLVKVGAVQIDSLVAARPYVIVAAFLLGMLLTPPDVVSQILLAVPLCLLYEFGILIAKYSISRAC